MESYSFDLTRIFIGNLPVLFYAEIAIRTVVLYLYALATLRFLGRRSAGALTVVDVVVIVALGSAVGDPMFYPEVPVLHGMLVITLIVGLERLGLFWANRNLKVDRLLKGKPTLVVSNGVIDLDGLKQLGISNREIFQMARQKGYRNLGEIRRMYIETDDRPTIYGYDANDAHPGLQFEPPWEINQYATIHTGSTVKHATVAACINCGQIVKIREGEKLPPCPRCHQTVWSSVE